MAVGLYLRSLFFLLRYYWYLGICVLYFPHILLNLPWLWLKMGVLRILLWVSSWSLRIPIRFTSVTMRTSRMILYVGCLPRIIPPFLGFLRKEVLLLNLSTYPIPQLDLTLLLGLTSIPRVLPLGFHTLNVVLFWENVLISMLTPRKFVVRNNVPAREKESPRMVKSVLVHKIVVQNLRRGDLFPGPIIMIVILAVENFILVRIHDRFQSAGFHPHEFCSGDRIRDFPWYDPSFYGAPYFASRFPVQDSSDRGPSPPESGRTLRILCCILGSCLRFPVLWGSRRLGCLVVGRFDLWGMSLLLLLGIQKALAKTLASELQTLSDRLGVDPTLSQAPDLGIGWHFVAFRRWLCRQCWSPRMCSSIIYGHSFRPIEGVCQQCAQAERSSLVGDLSLYQKAFYLFFGENVFSKGLFPGRRGAIVKHADNVWKLEDSTHLVQLVIASWSNNPYQGQQRSTPNRSPPQPSSIPGSAEGEAPGQG